MRARLRSLLHVFLPLLVCLQAARLVAQNVALQDVALQDVARDAAPTLTSRLTGVLQRDANGHSPADDEIAAASTLSPQPTAAEVKAALPVLLKALESSDVPVRTYALTVLTALEAPTAPESPAQPVTAPAVPVDSATPAAAAATGPAPAAEVQTAPPGPAVFRPDVAQVLTPAIPQIASHLTEEVQSNRALTANVLAGFTPGPPAALYPPLLAYLKRDDAIGSTGLLVVGDLLQVGPVSESTASAIARFLARSDQTPENRANLVDIVCYKPYQSELLNKAVLGFLGSDDASLRARVILSLPALDLAPDVFADARTRVQQLAESSGESLQVVNAAKAVAPCWTQVKMTSGCPTYQ